MFFNIKLLVEDATLNDTHDNGFEEEKEE